MKTQEHPQFPGLKRRGYTIKEVTYIISANEDAVRALIDQGTLQTFRLADRKQGGIRITAKSLTEYIGDEAA